MRVEIGAPIVLVPGVDALWHVRSDDDLPALTAVRAIERVAGHRLAEPVATLCGLVGSTYSYSGPIRRRRCCGVCLRRSPRDLYQPELGPLPTRLGGRPRGKYARVSDVQLAALHAAYVQKGLSVNQLAELVWQKLGYASAQSCASSLFSLFQDRGYELRDRIEATVLASTKNGLSPRDWQERKRRRLEAGLTLRGKERQKRCAGVRTQYPRKGERCRRPAMHGSDFCVSHDPERAAEMSAYLERARARAAA